METVKKWYVVYTKPRWEKKVAELLAKTGYEFYCPLNKILKQWSDRKKFVDEPLFPSYVFVRVEESILSKVKSVDGVLNLVYWLRKPAVVRDNEIAAIKNFLHEHTNVQIEHADVNINDEVKITYGPLISREGKVIETSKNMVKLMLPSLGYAMIAQIAKGHVEVIVRKTIPLMEKPGIEKTNVAVN